MFNVEKEKEALKRALIRGEIDEGTYQRELQMLQLQLEFKKNNINKPNFSSFIFPICIVLIIIVFFLFFTNFFVKKEYKNVATLNNFSNPIQSNTSGSTMKIVDGEYINISFIASYDIQGRVVDVQNYFEYTTQNKLSPRDIGIVWGNLVKDSYNEKITWSSSGNRFLNWHVNDGAWLSSIGGRSYINLHFSNNHLIPSNDDIKLLIKKIKKDDFIQIKGYLVNVNYTTDNGGYVYWNSSTSRSDTGNGACEVIYVTDIKWLKQVE